jgi:hypothetical protein
MPKQLQVFLFCYATAMLNNSKIYKISNGNTKFFCGRLVTAQQFSQKNCNGKIDNNFFFAMFSTGALKEIWTSAYYWR